MIRRPKFGLPGALIQKWLDLIDQVTSVVTITQQIDFPRDQQDAKFLACALQTDADYFVTGDHDFDAAKKFGNTTIISVSQFVALVINAPP